MWLFSVWLSPTIAIFIFCHVILILQMTSSLPFQASGNTNPFDDFFSDTHGGTTKEDEDGEIVWDGDVDECNREDMDEKDYV